MRIQFEVFTQCNPRTFGQGVTFNVFAILEGTALQSCSHSMPLKKEYIGMTGDEFLSLDEAKPLKEQALDSLMIRLDAISRLAKDYPKTTEVGSE